MAGLRLALALGTTSLAAVRAWRTDGSAAALAAAALDGEAAASLLEARSASASASASLASSSSAGAEALERSDFPLPRAALAGAAILGPQSSNVEPTVRDGSGSAGLRRGRLTKLYGSDQERLDWGSSWQEGNANHNNLVPKSDPVAPWRARQLGHEEAQRRREAEQQANAQQNLAWQDGADERRPAADAPMPESSTHPGQQSDRQGRAKESNFQWAQPIQVSNFQWPQPVQDRPSQSNVQWAQDMQNQANAQQNKAWQAALERQQALAAHQEQKQREAERLREEEQRRNWEAALERQKAWEVAQENKRKLEEARRQETAAFQEVRQQQVAMQRQKEREANLRVEKERKEAALQREVEMRKAAMELSKAQAKAAMSQRPQVGAPAYSVDAPLLAREREWEQEPEVDPEEEWWEEETPRAPAAAAKAQEEEAPPPTASPARAGDSSAFGQGGRAFQKQDKEKSVDKEKGFIADVIAEAKKMMDRSATESPKKKKAKASAKPGGGFAGAPRSASRMSEREEELGRLYRKAAAEKAAQRAAQWTRQYGDVAGTSEAGAPPRPAQSGWRHGYGEAAGARASWVESTAQESDFYKRTEWVSVPSSPGAAAPVEGPFAAVGEREVDAPSRPRGAARPANPTMEWSYDEEQPADERKDPAPDGLHEDGPFASGEASPRTTKFGYEVEEEDGELTMVSVRDPETLQSIAVELPTAWTERLSNAMFEEELDDRGGKVISGDLLDERGNYMPVLIKVRRTGDPKTATEQAIMSKANGPASGLLGVLAGVQTKRWSFTVLEGVPGENRLRTIKDLRAPLGDAPLSLEIVYPMLIDVLRGVESIEKAGYVHWKLTPDDIRILPDGRSVIWNFFEAVEKPKAAAARVKKEPETYFKRGSVFYSAPELEDGTPPEPSSGIWPVGMIFAELALGYHPVSRAISRSAIHIGHARGEEMRKLTHEVIQEGFDLPNTLHLARLDATFYLLILGMLEKDPEKRWPVDKALREARFAARRLFTELDPDALYALNDLDDIEELLNLDDFDDEDFVD